MGKTVLARASYMKPIYNSRKMNKDARRIFSEHDVNFDTLVGVGLSGSLVVPQLAKALGKHWLVVRKKDDGSHSTYPGEGTLGERWVFVDDLIASGSTKTHTRRRVEDIARCGAAGFATVHVGDYLYNEDYAGKARFIPGAGMFA